MHSGPCRTKKLTKVLCSSKGKKQVPTPVLHMVWDGDLTTLKKLTENHATIMLLLCKKIYKDTGIAS